MLKGENEAPPLVIHLLFLYILLLASFLCRTGMAGVPGTASAIFSAVKDVGANVIMISQVSRSSDASEFTLMCTIVFN